MSASRRAKLRIGGVYRCPWCRSASRIGFPINDLVDVEPVDGSIVVCGECRTGLVVEGGKLMLLSRERIEGMSESDQAELREAFTGIEFTDGR